MVLVLREVASGGNPDDFLSTLTRIRLGAAKGSPCTWSITSKYRGKPVFPLNPLIGLISFAVDSAKMFKKILIACHGCLLKYN